MASKTDQMVIKTVYRTLKAQRIQIDGKVIWHPIGKDVDPKWIHPIQLARMLKLGFLEKVEVSTPADLEPQTSSSPPVAPPKRS
jgi:hypothetical protein